VALAPTPALEHVAATETAVRAWGRHAVVVVESPLPGVLRVRAAPRALATSTHYPELPPKASFARVAGPPAGELRVDQEDSDLVLSTEGATLRLSLATGGWLLLGGNGEPIARALGYDGEAKPGFPIDRHRARLALVAPEGEAYLGLGEKVGPLDKRGMRFSFWNTDAFPPQPHTDPLYASIPFFVALRDGRAWGLFLDEPARSHVDLASSDPAQITWEIEGPEMDVYLLAGPTPKDVLRRYADLTGRPFLPPLFALGAQQSRWGYESDAEVRAVVRGFRSRGLPLDVVYLDIDHMEAYRVFTFDRARFPDPAGLTRELAGEGVRVVTIVDPALKVAPGWAPYDEALDKGYLVELDRGGPLVGAVWPEPAVFPDLTRPEVQRYWGDLQRALLDAGVSGVWNDMNEPACFSVAESPGLPMPSGGTAPGSSAPLGSTLPDEARHGTRRHLEVHNAYGLGMARAAFEGLSRHAPGRRPFVLTRAAYAGIQRYAALWTGDFGSQWHHLEATLPMLLGLGLSGVPFVGADVPGFVGDASGELLVRWTQAMVFAPLCRNHSARGTRSQEPWRFGEPWLSHVRRAYELRYRLMPALYTAMVDAHETGLPALAPLVLEHPGDADALAADDELLLAGALLVAPVVRPHQTRRMVYLPRGRYRPLDFDLEAAGPDEDGGRHVIADAPLDRAPMYLAAGRGFAATGPALHTTTAEWGAVEWHLFPTTDGVAEASLYEDAGDGRAGEGPEGTRTRVRVEKSARGLRVTRTISGAPPHGARTRERLRLHGAVPASRVEGARAHAHERGTLTVELEPGWSTVEIVHQPK
jgi:alpha-glucosidase